MKILTRYRKQLDVVEDLTRMQCERNFWRDWHAYI